MTEAIRHTRTGGRDVIRGVTLAPTGSTRRRCAALPGAEGVRARLPWPQVRLLAVAPPGRGRGVGAVLMQECVRRARAAGAPVLALPTTELMRAALRLYRLDLG